MPAPKKIRRNEAAFWEEPTAEFVSDCIAENSFDLREMQELILAFQADLQQQHIVETYRFPPVDIVKFVENENYLNKKGILFPEVMKALIEINSGYYIEAVLTGAIGVAKTTIAIYTQAYQLYLLSCMRNPHKVFELDPSSEIVIVFQSINATLARSVDYDRFRDMVEKAPYFTQCFPMNEEVKSEMQFPMRIVVKPISGRDTGAIGQNVIGGVIDEVNYMAVVDKSKMSRDGSIYDQAIENYNALAVRRKNRFMRKGVVPGMLCLVSSRNYPGQFTDVKEEEARTNDQIYIYDKRLWEIVPKRFGKERFRVFVGSETRKPRVLNPGETVTESEQPLVLRVPTEYRTDFDNDLMRSLRDIAGVATQAIHPFMVNQDAVTDCFSDKVQSITSRPDCDLVHTTAKLLKERVVNKQYPRFAHLDLAYARDSCGIAIGHVPRFQTMHRGHGIVEILPVIQYDVLLEVRPPKNGEIEFERLRRMIVLLCDMQCRVKWVTFDSFQSKDSMQILSTLGFTVGNCSMDTDNTPYDMLKGALYDGRVIAPMHRVAMRELVRLEYDAKHRKIDHPPNGSKDVADAMAGVCYGLSRQTEIWNMHNVPIVNAPPWLTVEAEPKPKKVLAPHDQRQMDRRDNAWVEHDPE